MLTSIHSAPLGTRTTVQRNQPVSVPSNPVKFGMDSESFANLKEGLGCLCLYAAYIQARVDIPKIKPYTSAVRRVIEQFNQDYEQTETLDDKLDMLGRAKQSQLSDIRYLALQKMVKLPIDTKHKLIWARDLCHDKTPWLSLEARDIVRQLEQMLS